MVRSAPVSSAWRLAAGLLAVAVLTGCGGGDDDVADEEGTSDATLPAPQTFPPQPIDATIPGATLPDEDRSSVDEALADGSVTTDELVASYDGYIECLATGGGAGRYAYDIELRTGLVVDWTIADGDTDQVDRDVLGASCSRRYLGDLTRRFERANPPGDDLADRRRASIAACIEVVSPAAAANLPAEISVGTAGEASSLSELQLDPSSLDPDALGASADDLAAVSSCFASMGAEWRPFG